jgi:DNA-binding transcriptional LysR family regulator
MSPQRSISGCQGCIDTVRHSVLRRGHRAPTHYRWLSVVYVVHHKSRGEWNYVLCDTSPELQQRGLCITTIGQRLVPSRHGTTTPNYRSFLLVLQWRAPSVQEIFTSLPNYLALLGIAIGQAAICRLPTPAARLDHRSDHLVILVNQVDSGGFQDFGFPCQFSFHEMLHLHHHPRLVQ